jgi:hypothetical protein
MGTQVSVSESETMECPLCLGEGKLKRAEVLERLGMKDFARVAQLSAEEAFRLLRQKHTQDESNAWVRFETELTKQVTSIPTAEYLTIDLLDESQNIYSSSKPKFSKKCPICSPEKEDKGGTQACLPTMPDV